jgi:hypothetical protein
MRLFALSQGFKPSGSARRLNMLYENVSNFLWANLPHVLSTYFGKSK